MKQNDLRVIKTRKNIEESFIELLEKKDFHRITVQDLLDQALINRSTFYKHYSDKYELAQILCSQVFEMLKTGVEERFGCEDARDIFNVLSPLYHTLSEKKKMVLALFTIHTETIHLYDDMSAYLQESYYNHYKEKNTQPEYVLDYLSSLYAALVMNAIKWCLKTGRYEQLGEHSELLLKFAAAFEYPEKISPKRLEKE